MQPTELSGNQKFFLSRCLCMGPTSVFNLIRAFRLERVSGELLLRAVQLVCERHEVFRIRLVRIDEAPAQQVLSTPRLSVSHLTQLEPLTLPACQAAILKEQNHAFDVFSEILLRITLLEDRDGAALFVVNIHHLISDGWSLSLMLQEISQTYRALVESREVPNEPTAAPYSEYIQWQRQLMATPAFQRQIDFWRHRLQGITPRHGSPDWRARTFRTCSVTYGQISAETTQAAVRFSQEQRTPLFLCLLSVYVVVLARALQQNDIVLGSIFSNRKEPRFLGTLGCMSNLLIWRVALEEAMTFSDVLGRVKRESARVYANSDICIDDIGDAIVKGQPIRMAFSLQGVPAQATTAASQLGTPVYCPESSREAPFDLNFLAVFTNEHLGVKIVYDPSCFSKAAVDELLDSYEALLRLCVRAPLTRVADIGSVVTSASDIQASEAVRPARG